MQTIWVSPTDYVTGDSSLRVSYPSVSHPNTTVTSKTTGDLKWISIDLRLPPHVRVEEVIVCYQVANARSYISQVRLAEMNTPDRAVVIHDDGTDLKSTAPICYSSKVGGKVPTPGNAVTLALRLNFQDTADRIFLGAVGIRVEHLAECSLTVMDFGAVGDGFTDDTVAIQKALDFVADMGGGIIRLQPKTYKISKTLLIKSNNTWLAGCGFISRLNQVRALGNPPRTIIGVKDAHVPPYAYYVGCALKDFSIYSDSADIGIDFSGLSYSIFENLSVQLKGSNKKCFLGKGNQGASPYYNSFNNLIVYGDNMIGGTSGSVGFSLEGGEWLGGSNGPNANNFSNIMRMCSLDYGVDISSGNGNLWNNIQFEAIGVAAFRLNYYEEAIYRGTSSGFNELDKLNDTSQSWTLKSLVNCAIKITSGAGNGQIRRIKTNDATQISIYDYWTIIPGAVTYEIYPGKAAGNKFIGVRIEGGETANFIQMYPGAYFNSIQNCEVGSISTRIVDDEVHVSNKLLDGDLIGLTFFNECIEAGLNNSYTFIPKRGCSIDNCGGHSPLGQEFCLTAMTVSCTGRFAGKATVTVDAYDRSFDVDIDADHPFYNWRTIPYKTIRSFDKINVCVSTTNDWSPAGLCVDVWGWVIS